MFLFNVKSIEKSFFYSKYFSYDGFEVTNYWDKLKRRLRHEDNLKPEIDRLGEKIRNI